MSGHVRQACAAFTEVSPSTVLGLSVAEDTTILRSLLADAGIQTAIKALEDASDKTGAARTLCNEVAKHAESLGLNRYDEAAVVWAFTRLGPISTTSSNALTRDRNVCPAMALAFDVKLL